MIEADSGFPARVFWGFGMEPRSYRPGTAGLATFRKVKPTVEVEVGAHSHPGLVRTNNEDCFLVSAVERRFTTLMTNLGPGSVPQEHEDSGYGLLVADGVGGAAAGEVASSTAVSVLIELALGTPDWIMDFAGARGQEVLKRMEERFRRIQDVFVERARAEPGLAGMGTTMTLAGNVGADLIIAHVGDSRAYLFRAGRLRRLTHDQTMAQMLADAGAIRPEEVATHPSRHVLTGAITTDRGESPVELHHLRLTDGDQILLSTDGLTEMVAEDAIAEALGRRGTATETCRSLVDLALEGGGKDNVTVVLARYRISEPREGG
jgi:PPM family protein phosphatase